MSASRSLLPQFHAQNHWVVEDLVTQLIADLKEHLSLTVYMKESTEISIREQLVKERMLHDNSF